MGTFWLVASILLPIVGGLCSMTLHHTNTRRWFASVLLVIELFIVAILVPQYTGQLVLLKLTGGIRFVLQVDGLGRFFSPLICMIWFAVAVFAYEYMNHEGHKERFIGFYLMTLGTLMGICFSGNLVTLYMFYEAMTLMSVPLVLHIGTPKAFHAAYRYLGFSVAGAGLGLLGQFVLQNYCTTDLFTPGGVLDKAAVAEHRTLLFVVFVVMAIGFGCKAGMFPLHGWLPVAHPVAPAPASAVLSGLITKMGIVALLRVVYYLYGWEFLMDSWAQKSILVLSLLTIILGSSLAMREDTLKKRLAYSTISQVSYVIFGLMLFHPIALAGALLQVLFHAIAKNTLFMATGSIIYKTHLTQVSQMRGVGKSCGITMWCFTISSLSLIGIPATGGFVSKWYLTQGALHGIEKTWAWVGVGVLMLSALLTAGYLLPIVVDAFFPGKNFDVSALKKQEDTWLMWITLCLLTAMTVIWGVMPTLLNHWVYPIIQSLF